MLLKTHVEKMSVLATPTIFMKTRDLCRLGHDIHENKGSYPPGSTAPGPWGLDAGGRSEPRRGPFPGNGSKKEFLMIRSKPECL